MPAFAIKILVPHRYSALSGSIGGVSAVTGVFMVFGGGGGAGIMDGLAALG